MIAAGFANFLSSLAWSTNDVVFTFGQALDLLPPVLFLHVFLAFPSGRLRGRFERWLVVTAYVTAIGLELVRMTFGLFGPLNLLEINENADAALVATRVQLTLISAYCLTVWASWSPGGCAMAGSCAGRSRFSPTHSGSRSS